MMDALQCAPSEDEARLLAAFRRNDAALAGLADAELFCLDLMTVSCCCFAAGMWVYGQKVTC